MSIYEKLLHSISKGNVSHAYLFTGSCTNIGRDIAGNIAGTLLCGASKGYDIIEGQGDMFGGIDIQETPDTEKTGGCGVCPSCIRRLSGNHPDLLNIKPEAGSIKIDTVRGLIEELAVKPYEGGWRVCILDGAETMTAQSQNCLLKTLEEPPASAVLILICANPSALLPTIISRCTVVRSIPQTIEKTEEFLSASGVEDKRAREAFARLSGGDFAVAELLAKDEGAALARKTALILFRAVANKDKLFPLNIDIKDIKDHAKVFYDMLETMFRDAILIKLGDKSLVWNMDILREMESCSKSFTLNALKCIMDILVKSKTNISRNANYLLNIDDMLIRIQEVIDEDGSWGKVQQGG